TPAGSDGFAATPDERDAVRGGGARGKLAATHRRAGGLLALRLAEIVRAGRARQHAEPVRQRGERAERVGGAAFVPAVHTRADPGEDGAVPLGLRQDVR